MAARYLMIVLFCLFFSATALFADTLVLKDGSEYKGAILQEDRKQVELITEIGIFKILKSNISHIKKGSMWENNTYLKKAAQYGRSTEPAKPAKVTSQSKKVTAPQPESTSTDYALRQREMELREQELELKKMELELLREEIKLRREQGNVETTRPVAIEQRPEGGAPVSELEAESQPQTESADLSTEVTLPSSSPEEEEEKMRQIAIEEQQKETERQERLETYRRLQEVRQDQEGVTIRGKINPAGKERYSTY